jgi:hypothetical protein
MSNLFTKLTTDSYLNATAQLLYELKERKPLALVKVEGINRRWVGPTSAEPRAAATG